MSQQPIEYLNRGLFRVIFTFFIGLLIALFVGLGIQAFYPPPANPIYPAPYMAAPVPGATLEKQDQFLAEQQVYQDKESAYQTARATYARNASLLAVGASVVLLGLSLTILEGLLLITDGVLLGGLFTLAYSIFLILGSNNAKMEFLLVGLGLIMVLAISYIRLLKPKS
jgi:hypothetical protein